MDRWGCPDSDGDGWSDPTAHWLASPGGMADAWPADVTQWHDRDGDGRGDNPRGTTADVCPDTPEHLSVRHLVETGGVAMTPMVMVGLIKATNSLTSQPNGAI